MGVQALYALQNGFLGAPRSLLFYGDFSAERAQIPVACYLVRATDGTILFDTGLSPRAVPGLLRNDPMACFTNEDLLVHRLDVLGLEADDIDVVVLSHLHYDHAGGAELFARSELVVVWNPALALHAIKRLKTLARLTGARAFPGHAPEFWRTVKQSPDACR